MITHLNFEVYVSLFCKSKIARQVKNTTLAILIKNTWLEVEMVFIAKQRFNPTELRVNPAGFRVNPTGLRG